MDTDNIFDLFDDSDSLPTESTSTSSKNNLKADDILINAFIRLILDFESNNKNMLVFLKQIYKDLDMISLSKKNKLIVYSSAYEYIARFDIENQEHVDALLQANPTDFVLACDKLIEELALYEQYEVCAFLKNLKDFITFSQKKLPL